MFAKNYYEVGYVPKFVMNSQKINQITSHYLSVQNKVKLSRR